MSPSWKKGSVTKIMNLSRSTRYFRSICQLVYDGRYGQSYDKLFEYLYSREFYWFDKIPLDVDRGRALDGIDLRYRYGCSNDYIDEPCSVLEMIIALAIRIENQIMTSFEEGNRTGQWFWLMITNLGLNRLDDDNFNEETAEWFVNRFLERDYADNGEGGLFVVENPFKSMTEVDIWTQANWYLSEMDGYL